MKIIKMIHLFAVMVTFTTAFAGSFLGMSLIRFFPLFTLLTPSLGDQVMV